MNRIIAMILALILSIGAAFFGPDGADGDIAKLYQVPGYDVWVTVPSDWEKTDSANMDIQLTNGEMNLSIWVYSKEEPAAGQSALDFFLETNGRLLEKRDDARQLEDVSVTEEEDRTLYHVRWSAVMNGHRNYYDFSFIDFRNTGTMMWVMVNGLPSTIEDCSEDIRGMVSAVTDTAPELYR